MVRGLKSFQKHFESYTDHYVLIGGTACDMRLAEKALEFRRTKDLDIILVVEALTDDFVQHFWGFIRAGGYEVAEVDAHKRFYRFIRPKDSDFPTMLELFARHPGVLQPVEGLHITDIPTGEDVSSLSAILMDDDYYHFTLANSDAGNGLHLASDVALIALKAKAFLNNRQRKRDGQPVQDIDITKHKNDVIRLVATIAGAEASGIPEIIRKDIAAFIGILPEEPDNIKELLKPWGLGNIRKEDIIAQLRTVFGIGDAAASEFSTSS
jgi:hypothetical protein